MELRTELELREAIQSLESQLRCLYEERMTESGDVEVQAPRDLDASLLEQLEDLYSEREACGDSPSALAAAVESLDAQLCELYAEKVELGVVRAELARLHADYEGLRSERARNVAALDSSEETVRSLDLQVVALIEERDELAREFAAWKQRTETMIRALTESAIES